MIGEEYNFGRCGVFCEMCSTGNGKLHKLASELLRLTKGEYDWAKDTVDFSFDDLEKGLEWLTNVNCPTCKNIRTETAWCDVLKCDKIKEVESCLLCDEFLECSKTSYHRERYPFVVSNYLRVKEIGIEKHFAEEREKVKDGVLLIDIRKW